MVPSEKEHYLCGPQHYVVSRDLILDVRRGILLFFEVFIALGLIGKALHGPPRTLECVDSHLLTRSSY